jgi:hypothetical protein
VDWRRVFQLSVSVSVLVSALWPVPERSRQVLASVPRPGLAQVQWLLMWVVPALRPQFLSKQVPQLAPGLVPRRQEDQAGIVA